MQSSLTLSQSNGEHSSFCTGDLGQNTHNQGTLGHLIFVGEDKIFYQSALGSIVSLISSHPNEYLCISAPQEIASPDHSYMGYCLSAKGTLKGNKFKQINLGPWGTFLIYTSHSRSVHVFKADCGDFITDCMISGFYPKLSGAPRIFAI